MWATMKKKWPTIIVVILAAVGLWLYFGVSSVFTAERDLIMRLDELVTYYASLDKDYVQPLITNPVLPDADKATLSDISSRLKTLASSTDASEKFENLLLAQKATMSFFITPGLPEEFTADARYVNWNKNASSLGETSRLVHDYNVALSLYNARLRSPAGKIARYWRTVEHRSYLGVDGTLQDETRVSF